MRTIKTKKQEKKDKQVALLTKAVKRISVKPLAKPPTKKTPFGDAGAILGRKLGSGFGLDLSSAGRWLGSGIGSIFGSGDYTMVGESPQYNAFSGQIPKFSTTRATNVVCHREYLGDITGTSGFTNLPFGLNPGVAATFPWLSQIAVNYQQYKFHGLVFEFNPLITDFITAGAPGVVVMATDYNSSDVAYASKQQMENTEFAVSVKPTKQLMHMIECAPSQTTLTELYVRSAGIPTGADVKLYDLGKFQFATQGNPTQALGELWVSYCVEFFKPEINFFDPKGNSGLLDTRVNLTTSPPFGTASAQTSGQLTATYSLHTMTLTTLSVGTKYVLGFYTSSNTITTLPITGSFISGANLINYWEQYTGSYVSSISTPSTTGTDNPQSQICFIATANTAVFYSTNAAGDGALTITVQQMDATVITH